MPSTPPTTNLIISRPRPPTWIFLPPPEDPVHNSPEPEPEPDFEPNADFLPPYHPPPTRPPPLAPPRRIYLSRSRASHAKWNPDEGNDARIDSSMTMTPASSYASVSSSLSRGMHGLGGDGNVKELTEGFKKEQASARAVESSPTSTTSHSHPNSNSHSKPSTPGPDPEPATFHPISHAPLFKSSKTSSGTQTQAPPRIRPPIPKPLISDILASEFYASYHARTRLDPDLNLDPNLETQQQQQQQQQQQEEEEDTNDWVIIPRDEYSISPFPSPARVPPIPQNTKANTIPNNNPYIDPGKTLTTLGYLFNFLMTSKSHEPHEN